MRGSSEKVPHGVPEPTTRAGLALHEYLTMRDVRLVLGLKSDSAARRAVVRLGVPYARIGRRILVRREALTDAIRAREVTPAPALRTLPVRQRPRWAQPAVDADGGAL